MKIDQAEEEQHGPMEEYRSKPHKAIDSWAIHVSSEKRQCLEKLWMEHIQMRKKALLFWRPALQILRSLIPLFKSRPPIYPIMAKQNVFKSENESTWHRGAVIISFCITLTWEVVGISQNTLRGWMFKKELIEK